jgi:putative ABC transport system permease protein
MYMSHFVWMSEACYQSVFGTVPAQNSVFLKLKDGTDPASCEQAISAYSEVSSLDFCYSTLNTWKNTVHSLNLVVYVLIISSMALAFVVLGNLTNVNISERTREIATLKVLGFRKREVESYIYKENMVLTVIGALCGIPL